MSGLEIIIPMVFEAVASTAAAVSTTVASLGAAVLSTAAAIPGLGALTGLGATAGATISSALGGGLLGSVIGGAVSTGISGALVGGVTSLVTGGDFLDGVEKGAIGGAITGGLVGGTGLLTGAGNAVQAPDIAGEVNTGPITATTPNIAMDGPGTGGLAGNMPEAPVDLGDAGQFSLMEGPIEMAGPANSGSVTTGPGVRGPAADLSAPNPHTQAPVGSGGLFDGLLTKETLGGALSGVGKVLSGDTAKAAARENNQGAMNRQQQQQQYISGNYANPNGLLTTPVDQGAGRPTPAQQFAGTQIDPSEREYYYDPQLKQIVYRRRA